MNAPPVPPPTLPGTTLPDPTLPGRALPGSGRPVRAIGLMTGTVLDGNIDVALLESDGESIEAFGRYALVPYDRHVRDLLEGALAAARGWQFAAEEPAIFAEAEAALTDAQAEAVSLLIRDAGLAPDDIDIIGFHGQSVLHRPPDRHSGATGRSRQLGDGARMARRLGIPVAFDFRAADVLAGGQGAPLSPVYHLALLRTLQASGERAVLNLGGVANLTWWDGAERLVAFDTGPANAPLNDFVRSLGLGDMDRNGALAAAGQVDERRLAALLEHPYLAASWPKSLDRFDFGAGMADGLCAADGAALLTAFTAAAIGRALDLLPARPARLLVCGGGRHNPSLMGEIERRARVGVTDADTLGWHGDAIEAQCFAYLAIRTLRELPISFPDTTGVPRPMCGGRIARP